MSYETRRQWVELAKATLLPTSRRADRAAVELLHLYDEAAYTVEQEISALYGRYARDNQLTAAQADRLITGKEYSVWRQSIEGYLAEAAGAGRSSKALLELNTLAAKSRISRKEQLLSEIYRNMIDLAQDSTAKMDGLLGDILRVNYEESCWQTQLGLGMGWRVAGIDTRRIHKILAAPWSEKHYSEAVWGHCDHLAALAKREITLGVIQGSSIQQMAKAIDQVMDSGRYAAERLVRTESKHFAMQGEVEGMQANGITRYRFLGGPESGKYSCACADLNGRSFALADAVPGVNLPPIHPNCVCTIVAETSDRWRAPAGAKPLQSNTKFAEWKKKYLVLQEGADTEKYHSITDEAIRRVPEVRCKSLSAKQARQLAEEHRSLLQWVRTAPAGTEGVACYDLNLQMIGRELGSQGSVAIPRSGIPTVAIHNHPNGLSFSLRDLATFCLDPNLQVLTAVGNNGAVYLVERTKRSNDRQLYQYIKGVVTDAQIARQKGQPYKIDEQELIEKIQKMGVNYSETPPQKAE